MLKLNLLCFVLAFCWNVNGLTGSSNSGCQSDTLILVDSTGSVSKIFNDEKLYVQKLLNQLDPVKNHVALIVYSSKYRHTKLLSFKSEQSRKSLSNLANLIPFFNGVTHNGAALTAALGELKNRRNGVPANLVVVTDGFSFDRINDQAALLRSTNQLRTFAVSVGQFYQRAELLQIAGEEKNIFVGPNSTDALVKALGICGGKGQEANKNDKKTPQVPTENKKLPTHPPSPQPTEEQLKPLENKPAPFKKPTDLKSPPLFKPEENNNGYETEPVHPVKKEIPTKPVDKNLTPKENKHEEVPSKPVVKNVIPKPVVKNVTPKPVVKNVTPKESKHEEKQVIPEKRPACNLDVVFVLDVSSSIQNAFDQQKTIAADIYEFLTDKVSIHYSVVKFSGVHRSKIVVPMSENKTAEQFRHSLDLIQWSGGTTYIVKALKQVTEMLSNHSKEHKTLIIVITDGFVRDNPEKDVKDLQSKGTVFLVPSAKDFPLNKLEFRRMASQEKYAFMDRNLDSIKNAITEVTTKC